MFLTSSQVKRRHGFIQPLQALEKAPGVLHQTLQTAQLFAQIQRNLSHFLQQDLGMHCYVVRLDQERLVLAVPNSAIASKLRQFAPSIAQHLQQYGYHIQQLNIKIHAGLTTLSSTKEHISQQKELSTNTPSSHRHQQFRLAFAKLLEQEPESHLAPTLMRLLKK